MGCVVREAGGNRIRGGERDTNGCTPQGAGEHGSDPEERRGVTHFCELDSFLRK